MARGVKLKLFRCPECGDEQRTIGTEVRHRCRGKSVRYELVEESPPNVGDGPDGP
jgi:hypothetical protein